MSSAIVDRLTKQIEAAENAAENASEPTTEQAPSPEEAPRDQQPALPSPPTPPSSAEPPEEQDDQGPEPPKRKRIAWKQRYTEMRASLENNLYRTKKDLAAAKEENIHLADRVQTLQNQLQETQQAQTTSLDDLFTPEDKDQVGEESLEIFKRAAEHTASEAVKPYQQQLEEERRLRLKRDQADADRQRTDAAQLFLNRLSRAVPNWQEVNFDPAFIQWLGEVERYSGQARMDLFKQAEQTGDVARVAGFMQEFLESQKQPDMLADQIGPEPSGAPSQAPASPQAGGQKKVEYVSMADVRQFYKDVAQGKIRDQKRINAAVEAIDQAQLEGRIVP